MPASSPRVYVTLKPETAEVVAELSKLLEQSESRTIAEVVDVAVPAFQKMILVLRARKRAEELGQLSALSANGGLGALLAKVTSRRMKRRVDVQWRDFIRVVDRTMKRFQAKPAGGEGGGGRKRSASAAARAACRGDGVSDGALSLFPDEDCAPEGVQLSLLDK